MYRELVGHNSAVNINKYTIKRIFNAKSHSFNDQMEGPKTKSLEIVTKISH